MRISYLELMKGFLFKKVVNNVVKIVAIPTFMSAMVFAGNFILALSDGVITDDEFHSLLSLSSGSSTAILVVVMAILKIKK